MNYVFVGKVGRAIAAFFRWPSGPRSRCVSWPVMLWHALWVPLLVAAITVHQLGRCLIFVVLTLMNGPRRALCWWEFGV